ncbi:MAG: hypothetical protein OEX00_03745, partial [Gammaproteobacteria bacterium]|nr:hypothetical protein [Gammaproteobacteria bacterium]
TLRKAPLSKIDAQHFVETLRFLAGSELDDNTLIKFEKSDFVTCPNCGSQNNLESKPENCYQCGTSLLTELMDDGIYLVDLTFKHEHIV